MRTSAPVLVGLAAASALLLVLGCGPEGPAPVAPQQPGGMPDPQKKEAARAAYKEGDARFREGRFAEAGALYKQADDLIPVPATKYKMAVVHDKLGQVDEAVAGYRTFLDSLSASPVLAAKMADQVADAKARIDALTRTPGAAAPPP